MKRYALTVTILFFVIMFSACGKSDNIEKNCIDESIMEACKGDLIKTLDEIKNSAINNESYIYNSDFLSTENVLGYGTEINKKIASLVEYSISTISIDDNNATIHMKMKAPDVYKIMNQIADGMEEDDMGILFERLSKQLNGKTPTQKYEIVVELKSVYGHWYLVPNGELANVFSGGLIEQYSSMGLNIIERLLEEDVND